MLLIPGAACDASVWDDTIAALPAYAVTAVTLAGFGGVPPIDRPLLHSARAELGAWLRALARPAVVVGHSLGAFLAFALAIDLADRVAAVIAVDGALALKSFVSDDPAARRARSPETGFAAWLEQQLAAMACRPQPAFRRLAARCDRAALEAAMDELWDADLRPDATAITAPVLLVLPGEPRHTRALMRRRAEAQLAAIARVEIRVIEGARHMIMLDAPAALAKTIQTFADAILAPR